MIRCYLIRHAQTSWNSENRTQGWSDVPLDSVGCDQANKLAGLFAQKHLAKVIASTLQRSQQTAEAISRGNGRSVPTHIEPDLGEIHLGLWEGLTPKEIDGRFPGAYQRWCIRPSSVYIPGAEPIAVFRMRVREAMARLLATWGDGEYAVVTHGGVIGSILADVLDVDYDILLRRLRLDNAGVSALEFETAIPHVLWINATWHLKAPEVYGAV